MARLTARYVESLGQSDRDVLVMDDVQSGFGLRITPSGTRLFLVRKRIDGKIIKRTIGQMAPISGKPAPHIPMMTIAEARKEAAKVLGKLAGKEALDPEVIEPEEKETFSQLADRWLEQHVRVKLKPLTIRDYERILDTTLRPRFGEKAFDAVTREEVRKLHAKMKDTPRRANYVLQVISAIYAFGEVGKNPAARIVKYREGRRERIMSAAELAAVGDAIEWAEREKKMSVWACEAIRFAIATGARPGEISAIEWAHVDEERKRIVLPDSKANRPRILYLSATAWTIVQRVPRFGKFVFAGRVKDTPFARLTNAWQTVRKRAGLGDVRLYDARHTFASEAAKAGHALPMIGALLGHSVPATTARYVHLVDDPVAKAAQEVGEAMAVAAAKLAEEKGPNVTALPVKGRARK
ncbi:MAG: tyrosine-type recombinase/integrase [Pseudomonadota bacterium]|nr:tyrosine-type recombinase/integrase [Pseudomonadota bacterium]